MAADSTHWPVKSREIADAYFESVRWNDFPFREGDVVVATYPNVGTNWMQQIVWQLIQGGKPAGYSFTTRIEGDKVIHTRAGGPVQTWSLDDPPAKLGAHRGYLCK